ncbi:glycosyltransferase family A protein [Sphingobacterium sp. GVS05A]|uniref:glycosyltransferase family A protein n=1 Tax=Sphingobacterium sp. GVS05A TaxID=2862679 RepID=UPI001CBCC147|nr:glycosyltransferase family A protein [Sphingobacterium sp. GVS05A]
MKAFSYTDEEIKNPSSFVHNFDLSIVMPFFKKATDFKITFPLNYPYVKRNGIEVVIVMDESSEENEVLEFIKTYPEINWRLVVNRNEHGWRNPSKAINVGIRFSTKKYILVCSPESEFKNDVLYTMRKTLHFYPDHFTTGYVDFQDFDGASVYSSPLPYGSIMVEKKHLVAIKGYDESIHKWGGDDDNIRARLEMVGVKRLSLSNALLVHRESQEDLAKRKDKHRTTNRPPEIIKSILYPSNSISNCDNWGKDFDEISYDWKNKPNDRRFLLEYLNIFQKYVLCVKDLSKTYGNILLVQCYNEKDRVQRFLIENAKFCDGIVVLDDGSEDGSFEIINHEKILLKVQKHRDGFNDLENRNILLKLASFFNTQWITFLDFDEIIDKRYNDMRFINDESIDVVALQLVHLWDKEGHFNGDYPFSKKGIQIHFRMFRNIGYSQILTDKHALHFTLTPYVNRVLYANVLVLHYGHINRINREKKFKFYSGVDKKNDQIDYLHLLDNNPFLKRVSDIVVGDFVTKS